MLVFLYVTEGIEGIEWTKDIGLCRPKFAGISLVFASPSMQRALFTSFFPYRLWMVKVLGTKHKTSGPRIQKRPEKGPKKSFRNGPKEGSRRCST